MKAHFILYVKDQLASAEFYRRVLHRSPALDVPGMTEFKLNEGVVLGVMPIDGIKRLLGDSLPDPGLSRGVPRAEVYLIVENPSQFHQRALDHGATELSCLSLRDWGHQVAYSLDPDGLVLA